MVKPPAHIKPTIFAFRPAGSVIESRRAAEAITVEQVLEAFQALHSRIPLS